MPEENDNENEERSDVPTEAPEGEYIRTETPNRSITDAQNEGQRSDANPHEESRFAAGVSDDNSVLLDDPGFVGVSEEYRNAAYDQSKPLASENPAVAEEEQRAAKRELDAAERGRRTGVAGFEVTPQHPTERDPDESLVAAPDDYGQKREQEQEEQQEALNKEEEEQQARSNPFGKSE